MNKKTDEEDEMLDEYDFTGGVRGKYVNRVGFLSIKKSSMSKTKDGTVKETGAVVSRQLIGIEKRNNNLIVEIYKTQKPGRGGRIIGEFKIIDAGNGDYADYLKDFENISFNSAKEFIEQARLKNKDITHVINCNGLKIHK